MSGETSVGVQVPVSQETPFHNTVDHIIAYCPFTRELWHFILQALGFQLPQGAQSTLSWWRKLRKLSDGQQRKGLNSLFALVSWQVWKERNAICFRESAATVAEMLQIIKTEADLCRSRSDWNAGVG